MNPLSTLDSILSDWASPRVRRLVHALIALGLLVLTAVMAADGDWKVAIASLVATVYAAMNKANTPATSLDEAGADSEVDDGLTYEEAGGEPFPAEPSLYGQTPPLHQPGSDEDGFGGDAPSPRLS